MIDPDESHGPVLTKEEVRDCVAATGEDSCQACGALWTEHRQTCSGSAEEVVGRAGLEPACSAHGT